MLTETDLHLFNEGTHSRLYDKLGSHLHAVDGAGGVVFGVWAPNASSVSVVGDFNDWIPARHQLRNRGVSGIWEGFIPGARYGTLYKYSLVSRQSQRVFEKADPFAFAAEIPPRTASVVSDLTYDWRDDGWVAAGRPSNRLDRPTCIYEMHLGSWRRAPEDSNRSLSYLELAEVLPDYLAEMGFTHVELMPAMEHPFYGSWGYQTTGYFAPTSRYGPPQDFMRLVDALHAKGIGVILDWVPSHFPGDAHGLALFDGTHLYEHADPRLGFHPDWGSMIFNYGRHEVRSFLLSSAQFWLDRYHADGLRVDAVASMLYRDYSRAAGEWIPNELGGRENLDAVEFLKMMNRRLYADNPGVQIYAEESTSWPGVSRPTDVGGLGFGLKWDMGWMHDTLDYFAKDPVHRSHHHNRLTFRSLYAYSENFLLPLSHDEVVHGKGSLLAKMPGDDRQKFANLRVLLGYMYAQSGKKLLFMGGEFGQWREWNHDQSLDWHLLQDEPHAALQRWVAALNQFYCASPSLYELDCDPGGLEWIEANDAAQSVYSLLRRSADGAELTIMVANLTPVPRDGYRIGVPHHGTWRIVLSSDALEFGGYGVHASVGFETEADPSHGRPYSLRLNLPGLSATFLRWTAVDLES